MLEPCPPTLPLAARLVDTAVRVCQKTCVQLLDSYEVQGRLETYMLRHYEYPRLMTSLACIHWLRRVILHFDD